MPYVYQVELRDEGQGFNKTVSVEAYDVWRAVEGSFEELDAAGYDSDRFSVVELKRSPEVEA